MVVIVVAITACTIPVRRAPDLEEAAREHGELPYKVGLYYPPETRTFSFISYGYEYLVGESTVALFDSIFAGLFREVVKLDKPTSLLSQGTELDAVFEVRLSSFNMWQKTGRPDRLAWRASVTSNVTIYVPDGSSPKSWQVSGYYADTGVFNWGWWPGDEMSTVLEQAGMQFIAGFREWYISGGSDLFRK